MEEPLVHAAEPRARRPALMTTAFEVAKMLGCLIALLLCLAFLVISPLVWLFMTCMWIRMITGEPVDLFVLSEAFRAIGIILLFTKFWKQRTCAGLSLKSLELTALYLGIKVYCSVFMTDEWWGLLLLEVPILMATLWIIYMIRFKLRSSYMEGKDNFPICLLVVPCLLLSVAIHLSTEHFILNRILWAFYVYLKAVSALPQLWIIHNTKIVEPYKTYNDVTLGIAPFITIVNCVLQVLMPRGDLGNDLWPTMVFTSQAFQTLTLAYFCYCYIKCSFNGAGV